MDFSFAMEWIGYLIYEKYLDFTLWKTIKKERENRTL